MSPGMSDRLNSERHRTFVGRVAERELFRSALASDESPFSVLYVFGPGGVGKTSLLREFFGTCEEMGTVVGYVDARNLDPSPDALMGALCSALGLDTAEHPFDALSRGSGRRVVLIDTYETLAPLGAWITETFLPQLPESLLLVLASRNPPEAGWRVDPGWQRIIRPLRLQNLSRDESEAYLKRRNVPPDQHHDILDFTHGHPLALSLVADVFVQRPGVRFRPAETPDVIKTLLEQFVQQVPGPAHRTTLESCALVRYTTESLLGHMVTMPDVHELFGWLRSLTFIDSGPLGLFPHDVAREALVADLRWRNPDWYTELHHRARNYYASRLKQTHGQEQQRVLFDYVFLHRDNPTIRPFLEWQEAGVKLPEAMREADGPDLEALVERHEGPESARLAARWFARQPESVVIYRDMEQRPAGFVMKLDLRGTTDEDRRADPAVGAAWRHLEHNAPLRPGEKATLFRFRMAGDTYQGVSAMQSLIFGNIAQHYLTTPGLAFTFFPTAEPDFWAPMFAYVDLGRAREADFEVGGRRYGVYVHDWRVTPPMAWLDLLAQREVATEPLAVPAAASTPLVVLGESDFTAAVREALRDFHRTDALRTNPLLRSRVVVERAGTGADDGAGIASLRDLLEETSQSLQASPREGSTIGHCTVPTWILRPTRSAPRSYSAYLSALTAVTSGRASRRWPRFCGKRRSAPARSPKNSEMSKK